MNTSIILGQGIAGSTLAWQLHWAGHRVLIVDRGQPLSASRIAAGLITPVTGRRFTQVENFAGSLAIAEEFYRRVEAAAGCSLLEMKPSVRLFSDDEERQYFLEARATAFGDDLEWITEKDGQVIGFRMLKAGRLRVPEYLNVTRDYFAGLGQYHHANVNVTTDIVPHDKGVGLLNPPIEGTRLFFCQGFQAEPNPWFPGIPDAPSRGEVLHVRIPGRSDQQVIHRGYWLCPSDQQDSEKDDHQYTVGATYDRESLRVTVTKQGREELEKGLQQITGEEAAITGQVAAIRPGTRQQRTVCRIHQEYPQLAILNGLGSKGSLLAPIAARELLEKSSLQASTITQAEQKPRSLTKLAHSIVRRTIKPGDAVIDATAGNGHDTVFLTKCTGAGGRVTAIDIQDSAIQSTRARLEADGVSGVELLVADHSAELSQQAQENRKAKVIMFNLGYLPGGDKQQTTQSVSTVKAITAGLRMLSPGGVMTVVAYRGHPGGQQEALAVEELARRQEGSLIRVDVIPGSDENQESPVLIVFRRQ